MKKILLLLSCAFFMCSCGVARYSQTTSLADYRTYTQEGFTITPSASGFIYQSVGDISMDFRIGQKDGYNNPDAAFGMNSVFVPTYDYMTAEMVKEAQSLGANAMLNYKIEAIIGSTKYGSSVIGYRASGFAVKLIQ